jgi:cellulose synthase/poly-beta-1,6-N-acetylglucosamine synthase-like glycosyltransferase
MTPVPVADRPAGPGSALSIVIVTRNEEAAIARCIESALTAVAGRDAEVVLVDSASTDRTVEIASQYPITILQIDREAELSPAAGRFIGARETSGAFLHFLDGDMVMIEGWLDAAFSAMQDPTLAAVGGRLYRVYPGEDLGRRHPDSYVLGPTASLGGAGLYRRSAIVESGGFNPFVKGEEERELGHRIARKGYTVLRVDVPMVYHLEKDRTLAEITEKAGHFVGVGQILREYRGTDLAADVLARQRRVIRDSFAVVLPAIVLLAGFIMGGALLRQLVAGAALVSFLGFAATGRLRKAVLAVRFRASVAANIVRGYVRGIPAASTYAGVVHLLRDESSTDSRRGAPSNR